MKKKHLAYIIAVMSVALLGLIILQFYWITKTLFRSEQQFQQEVNAALTAVSQKLEKHETSYLVKSHLDMNVNADDYFKIEYDSANKSAIWKEQLTVLNKKLFSSEAMQKEGFAYEIEEEVIISKSGVARRKAVADLLAPDLAGSIVLSSSLLDVDSLYPMRIPTKQVGNKIATKAELVEIVLSELTASEKKPIEDRLSQSLLDSMLSNELHKRGIEAKYQFGVKQQGLQEKIIFASSEEQLGEILNSEFYIRLFPTDIFDQKNILHLYFPSQDSYIFSKMGIVLVSSVVFILLIIISFAYAVLTIVRQKKFSEITKDFIGNMTHELKTPIATVSLATEALMDPDIRKMPTQSERYLKVIKDENNRLSTQVERVLQIARLDKSDFKLNLSDVDIHEKIREAINNIGLQIESRDGYIETKLEASQYIIQGDSVHLASVINNLVDNANKYSPEKPQIVVKTENCKHGIKISVSDTGLGIAKDMIPKIFDKFYRVPTGNVHDVKGFGLGLSYVKTIVEAHKGKIKVESEPKKGSTFTISLPLTYGSDS